MSPNPPILLQLARARHFVSVESNNKLTSSGYALSSVIMTKKGLSNRILEHLNLGIGKHRISKDPDMMMYNHLRPKLASYVVRA